MLMKGRILVYTISGCPHCKAAKAKLADLALKYYEININEHPQRRDEMIKLTNAHTVPQIFFNDLLIGGNDKFQSLSEEELAKLIEMVKNEEPSSAAPEPQSIQNLAKQFKFDNLPDDDHVDLIKGLRSDELVVRTHKRKLVISHQSCFAANDFIKHICSRHHKTEKEAFEIGDSYVKRGIAHSVVPKYGLPFKTGDDILYRFLEDNPSKALNSGVAAYKKVGRASEVGVMLRNSILQLYDDFLSADGKKVDYDGMKKSKNFKEYVKISALLQRVEVTSLSRDEKLAFFINIYNALVIHGNISFGFPTSQLQRYKFFNNCKYLISGHEYSLQDVENGVLRANRKGVGQLTHPFGQDDSRLEVALKKHEPLIHFALVCGAKSCPPIKTYSSDHIMQELQLAGAGFVESDDNCLIDGREIKLSMIFKWYSVDFGNDQAEVVAYICSIMPNGDKKERLKKLIDENSFKVSYLTYNWDTNK